MYATINALIQNLKTDRGRPTNNVIFNGALDVAIVALENLKRFY
jgi:hypothetical protein